LGAVAPSKGGFGMQSHPADSVQASERSELLKCDLKMHWKLG